MSADTGVITLVDQDEWERQQAYTNDTLAPLFQVLERVKDPEIPALSIWDMGILRGIEITPSASTNQSNMTTQQEHVTVIITPTYSGCPAMDLIHEDILSELKLAGYTDVQLKTQLAPAWTTHWMSEEAKIKMAQSGIAPPESGDGVNPQCPVCGSRQTRIVSEFGSTACKALYKCDDCCEPFDYFKTF